MLKQFIEFICIVLALYIHMFIVLENPHVLRETDIFCLFYCLICHIMNSWTSEKLLIPWCFSRYCYKYLSHTRFSQLTLEDSSKRTWFPLSNNCLVDSLNVCSDVLFWLLVGWLLEYVLVIWRWLRNLYGLGYCDYLLASSKCFSSVGIHGAWKTLLV